MENSKVMKLKNIVKFIFNPKQYIYNIARNIAHQKLINQGYIPIYEFNENDIFLVAFPKSGITWLQNLIVGLLYGIDTQYLPDKLTQDIVPDIYEKSFYKRYGLFTIFKSHELPKKEYKRVIYLVRDGRDAIVSYYHYNKNLGINVSLEEMVLKNKNVFPAPWWQHTQSWINNSFASEIIYVRYEDLLKQPLVELKRICKFLNIERDNELIQRVIEGNTFELMKKKAKLYNGIGLRDWQGEKSIRYLGISSK